MAFFREVLRCFPIEPRLAKLTTRDSTIPGTRFRANPEARPPASGTYDGSLNHVEVKRKIGVDGKGEGEEKFLVAIPKGSVVMLDIWGLHMNRACRSHFSILQSRSGSG